MGGQFIYNIKVMVKNYLILIFFLFSLPAFAEYKGLKKLSKNNSFMDSEGKPYSIDEITNIDEILLIIWNHGSFQDTKIDKCKKKPQWGYEWDGAVVPAVARLHNKRINNLEIKIYRLCSGVRGLTNKQQDILFDKIKSNGSFELHEKWEYKQLKRQKIILEKTKEFYELGFSNIILAGYSAGGWASLMLLSNNAEIISGAIALNPAFAGPKEEWQDELPHWGELRNIQLDMFNYDGSLNALIFSHSNDAYEDPKTLSFLKEFEKVDFIDYSKLKPTSCQWADVDWNMEDHNGHAIPQSECFTKFIEKNDYIVNYLEEIFNN
tara:strand:- start:146 stop:1111 length:966 start_codon:yes stop_codon:yes gene_type:complete